MSRLFTKKKKKTEEFIVRRHDVLWFSGWVGWFMMRNWITSTFCFYFNFYEWLEFGSSMNLKLKWCKNMFCVTTINELTGLFHRLWKHKIVNNILTIFKSNGCPLNRIIMPRLLFFYQNQLNSHVLIIHNIIIWSIILSLLFLMLDFNRKKKCFFHFWFQYTMSRNSFTFMCTE